MFLGWGLWMACCFARNYRLYKQAVKRVQKPAAFCTHITAFSGPWFLIVLVEHILVLTDTDKGSSGTDDNIFLAGAGAWRVRTD